MREVELRMEIQRIHVKFWKRNIRSLHFEVDRKWLELAQDPFPVKEFDTEVQVSP